MRVQNLFNRKALHLSTLLVACACHAQKDISLMVFVVMESENKNNWDKWHLPISFSNKILTLLILPIVLRQIASLHFLLSHGLPIHY